MNKALLLASTVLVLSVAAGFLYYQHDRGGSSGPMCHVRNEFEFTIHAPYSVAAPLFGPEGERVWATDSWNPQFVYPQPAKDIAGAVFRVRHGHHHSTWVNTAFDLEQGHIQYVYMIPDVMATLIDLHLSKPSADSTHVSVAYERTALSDAANEHVREFGEADRHSGKEWGDDIERYFASRRGR